MNKNRIFKALAVTNFIVLICVFLMYKTGNGIFSRKSKGNSEYGIGQNFDSSSKNQEKWSSTTTEADSNFESKLSKEEIVRLASSKSFIPNKPSDSKIELYYDQLIHMFRVPTYKTPQELFHIKNRKTIESNGK